jgi:spermidine synthase
MARPWNTIAREITADGALELRQRGPRDFLITVDGRVLMNSVANRSELALGKLACRALPRPERPRVLVGGLGMAFTLRAVLDALPPAGQVLVAELNPAVVAWCRGPLAALTHGATADPRVDVLLEDVAATIGRAANGPADQRLDAVVLDLYEGPHPGTNVRRDPLYGQRAIERTHRALVRGGVFAVWGEAPDPGFEQRLRAQGFAVRHERPGRGGLRHVVTLANRTDSATPPRRSR